MADAKTITTYAVMQERVRVLKQVEAQQEPEPADDGEE
jgi:hypothetical protein